MRNVGDVLSAVRAPLVSVSPNDNVLHALKVMHEGNKGAVLVMENRKLVGIFSDRDLARRVTLRSRQPDATPIYEVMSADPLTVTPDFSAEECLSLMNRQGVRHLPVVNKGEVLGFVSILDVVNVVLSEKSTMINQLEEYVSETWPL